jgi:STE24 endopeptidase
VDATAILALFLALQFLELGLQSALTLLNLRHARRAIGSAPDEASVRRVSYTAARGRLALWSGTASMCAAVALAMSGGLGLLDDLVRRIPVHGSLQGTIFVALAWLVLGIVSLPFSLFATFAIEERFGFNRTTPRLYLLDMLKSLGIAGLIGAPVLTALFWFVGRAGSFWWLWAFGATSLLQLAMLVLSPLVVEPLFNRFSPLPEGTLKDRILALAARLGFSAKGIFVADGSRRSSHSNAYFTGIGRAKRIVLLDTLVSADTEEQIVSVLAHEIGHERLRHLWKSIGWSVPIQLVGFWVISLALRWQPLYRAFGLGHESLHALLVILAIGAGPLAFLLQPLAAGLSRRHEREADRFAVRAMGSAAGLKAALVQLSRDNLSDPSPHPLYQLFHASHPGLRERIDALDRVEASLQKPRISL